MRNAPLDIDSNKEDASAALILNTVPFAALTDAENASRATGWTRKEIVSHVVISNTVSGAAMSKDTVTFAITT